MKHRAPGRAQITYQNLRPGYTAQPACLLPCPWRPTCGQFAAPAASASTPPPLVSLGCGVGPNEQREASSWSCGKEEKHPQKQRSLPHRGTRTENDEGVENRTTIQSSSICPKHYAGMPGARALPWRPTLVPACLPSPFSPFAGSPEATTPGPARRKKAGLPPSLTLKSSESRWGGSGKFTVGQDHRHRPCSLFPPVHLHLLRWSVPPEKTHEHPGVSLRSSSSPHSKQLKAYNEVPR